MTSSDDSDFELLADKDFTDYNDAGYLPQSPEIEAAIQTWLSPTKYLSENSEYRKHVNSYLEGTGHWFDDSTAYQEWHNDAKVGALWVKAVAGAGKSVLAASTAARLAREEQVPVLFFFFRQIVALNHEPKYLMRDWLSQLLPFSPWLQSTLKQHVDDRKDINTISLDEMWRYICDALSYMPRAYCIADALDEMDDGNESFLQKLLELGKQKPGSIKVLMTSRPVPRIENVLRSHISQIRLDPEDVESDVDFYVDFRLKPIGGPPTFYETLKPILCRRAKGLFLYARLVTDELLEAVKGIDIAPADIPRILESVPDSLEDVYSKMLIEHSKRSGVSQEHQLTILQWVTHTTRPLRLIEAAAIMKAIGGAGETLKETKALVRRACGPLLEVLEDETLSVIHHSFTEYLTQHDRQPSHFPIIFHDETHRSMAITCIAYLCKGVLDEWEIRTPCGRDDYGHYRGTGSRADEELKLKHPLLEYAMSNWYKHANKSKIEGQLLSGLNNFFTAGSHCLKAWIDLRINPDCAATFTPIHAAAWIGAADLVRHLAQRGEPTDKKDEDSRTPLSHASNQGHTAVVAALLECKVDSDSDDNVGWRPIHYAARSNHYNVVRLLLGAGVDPLTGKSREHQGRRCGNAKRTVGETAVEYASTAGHTETILELIPYLQKEHLHKALHWAARNGRSSTVAALLQSPEVDVDDKDTAYDWWNNSNYGYTALFQATVARDAPTMRILLEKGASATIQRLKPTRTFGWSAPRKEETVSDTLTHFFAGKGGSHGKSPGLDALREAFDLILEAGCDVDSEDEAGKTPLHYACDARWSTECCDDIVLMLLQSGADASKLTKEGQSVFHLYQGGTSTLVVNALVEHGGNIDARITSGPNSGEAAVHSMMSNYREEVIMAFLEHKPDVKVQNQNGDTALHLRANKSSNSEDIMKRLLELGADVNARDNRGQTPIHALAGDSSFYRADRTTKLLIDAGADLDVADNEGKTLLSLALSQSQCEQSVNTILKLGANILVKDIQGRSICHLAVSLMKPKVVEFLVERGADPLAVDNFGNTLFHEAARQPRFTDERKQLEFLRSLPKLGISPKARNHQGYNSLHVAASVISDSWGRFAPIDFFLDPSHGIDVNEADNYGVRPLHLAASISESHVLSLLDAGADPFALTFEDQSALHVAARGRQSNIVGLLLRRLQRDGRQAFIDTVNKQGRTALHDACRSGRPETVELLLEAGADVTKTDKVYRTPLHVCAEALEERSLWLKDSTLPGSRRLHAANIMMNDPLRPQTGTNRSQGNDEYSFDEENELVRIREIIRLLLAHGAELEKAGTRIGTSALQLAVSKACEPMIQELLMVEAQQPEEKKEQDHRPLPPSWPRTSVMSSVQKKIYANRAKQMTDTLAEEMNDKKLLDIPLDVTKDLLRLGHDDAVTELSCLGCDFAPTDRGDNTHPVVHWLAGKGYAQILREIGVSATAQRMKQYDDSQWVAATEKQQKSNRGSIRPILVAACSRALPNLSTVKVLVDEVGVDINAQPRSHMYRDGKYQDVVTNGPLHILAQADHWWQTEALEFLLQHHANTEIRNEQGQTPLHVALNGNGYRRKYTDTTVATLLKHGSDPNATDGRKMSCLDYGSKSPNLIRLLVKYGADIMGGPRPPLLSAVRGQNVEAVATLIKLGADVNSPRLQSEDDKRSNSRSGMQPSELFAVYDAAFEANINAYQIREDHRHALIEFLLREGADPYRVLDNKTTIIHQIMESSSAVVAPFLSHSGLQLEHRDPKGRTLLLAACIRRSNRTQSPDPEGVLKKDALIQELVNRAADVSATDNAGKCVLHHLLESAKYQKSDDSISMFAAKYPQLVHIRSKEGYTPLHIALKCSCWWAAQILVDAGAELLDPDPQGSTALHYLACQLSGAEHALFKDALIIGGPGSINTKNHRGYTPVSCFLANIMFSRDPHLCSDRDNFTTKLLSTFESAFISNGADVFTKDNEGKGLLHVVAKKKSGGDDLWRRDENGVNNLQEMFRVLVGKGLDPWMEDNRQMTPLDVAAVVGNEDILKMFRREK